MRLDQMRSPGDLPLNKSLERLLVALEPQDAAVTELYAGLWDIHDGAGRIAAWIEELSGLDPGRDMARITRLLHQIRFELYDHLEKNHLRSLRTPLDELCERTAEQLEHA